MKKILLFALLLLYSQLCSIPCCAQRAWQPRENIPLDSIYLSDPFIMADKPTKTYYMTGTGGMMWKSRDLKRWSGPYRVAHTDSTSWMGARPMIWAAELHAYGGKYYYFGTFTNRNAPPIDTVRGNVIPRRACHILRSDRPEGPYTCFGDNTYLPAGEPTLDATFWVENGTPYLLFCHEWLQNWNGTVESIRLKPDLSGTVSGTRHLLFRAKESPWSRDVEDGKTVPNKVTDGPYVFHTATGRLGIIWTSWVGSIYTQGVAYSQSGTLNGPWVQQPNPLTPPNYGHGMLFQTFDGQWMMCIHSHRNEGGRYIRIPHLFEVDLTGDELKLKN